VATIPRPGFGTRFSKGRIGRGLFRESGQLPGTKFTFVPNWEHNTTEATKHTVQAKTYMRRVHDSMGDAMRSISRFDPGGGVEENAEGWLIGIGTHPYTRTHWHLIEFGGGHHFARSPVRNALRSMGKFEPSGRPS